MTRRRNVDERLRRLERAAAAGDPDAQERLSHERVRVSGLTPLSRRLTMSPTRSPEWTAAMLGALEVAAWLRIENWLEDRVPVNALGGPAAQLAFAIHVLQNDWRTMSETWIYDDFDSDAELGTRYDMPSKPEAVELWERIIPCHERRIILAGAWGRLTPGQRHALVDHFGNWVEADLTTLPCVEVQTMRNGRRWNSDKDLRRAERASTGGDPESQARLLVQRVRSGELDPWLVRAAVSLGHPGAIATALPPLSDDERKWTRGDITLAHRHGWDIFQTSIRGLEINALDEPPEDAVRFFEGNDRDGEAHRYVLSQARLGDRTAIKAILEIRDQRDQRGANFERAVVMVGQPLFDWLRDDGETVSAWYEEDLSPHYRKAAERAAVAVEIDAASAFLGLRAAPPDIDAILRADR